MTRVDCDARRFKHARRRMTSHSLALTKSAVHQFSSAASHSRAPTGNAPAAAPPTTLRRGPALLTRTQLGARRRILQGQIYPKAATMRAKTLQIVWHEKQPVFSVDFHPDGYLATGGADREIKVRSVFPVNERGALDGSPSA